MRNHISQCTAMSKTEQCLEESEFTVHSEGNGDEVCWKATPFEEDLEVEFRKPTSDRIRRRAEGPGSQYTEGLRQFVDSANMQQAQRRPNLHSQPHSKTNHTSPVEHSDTRDEIKINSTTVLSNRQTYDATSFLQENGTKGWIFLIALLLILLWFIYYQALTKPAQINITGNHHSTVKAAAGNIYE